MNTVESLRKKGYKVRVHHYRKHGEQSSPTSCGGKTVVEITTPDGITLVGKARCNRKENYNKKLGVRIALGRAMIGSGE